jgi:hypothetical protein
LLARFAVHIDIWKLGWGIAYLDPDLPEKLGIRDRHGVRPFPPTQLQDRAGVLRCCQLPVIRPGPVWGPGDGCPDRR